MGLFSFLTGGEEAVAHKDLDALSSSTKDLNKVKKAFQERNPRFNKRQVTKIVTNWESTRGSNSKD